MNKKVPPYERVVWCEQCKGMKKHLIFYVGRNKQKLTHILFYKICTEYMQMQYESQKLLFEEKYGTEFQEENFSVDAVVEEMHERDWSALLKGSFY